MHRVWIASIAVFLAACAGLVDRQQQEEISGYRADDAYCVQRGLHYPDAAYVACRRSLQDGRRHRKWENQRMLQAGASPATGKPATGAIDQFQPLDAGRFQCRMNGDYGGAYVACGEMPPPPR